MKKIIFFTALLAFFAGSTFAVSTYYTSDVTIENTDGDKDDKEKKSKKEKESAATTADAKGKSCASKKACCQKDAKANCKDDKKTEKKKD